MAFPLPDSTASTPPSTPGPEHPLVEQVRAGHTFEDPAPELGGLVLDAETQAGARVRVPLGMLKPARSGGGRHGHRQDGDEPLGNRSPVVRLLRTLRVVGGGAVSGARDHRTARTEVVLVERPAPRRGSVLLFAVSNSGSFTGLLNNPFALEALVAEKQGSSPGATPSTWVVLGRGAALNGLLRGLAGTFRAVGCDSEGMEATRPMGESSGATDEQDDNVLVARVADSDNRALRELYDRHAAWLHARLMRRCNDPEVVLDVVQDTFVALWKDARRFRGDGDVAAWLWGIGFRRMVSRLRARKDVVLLPDWDGATVSPALGISPAAEDEVLLGVEYGDLADAMRRLSPEFRAVVQTVVLDGLTTKEAGRLLGVRENTVKTRLHRAKAQLRSSLTGAGIEEGWR